MYPSRLSLAFLAVAFKSRKVADILYASGYVRCGAAIFHEGAPALEDNTPQQPHHLDICVLSSVHKHARAVG